MDKEKAYFILGTISLISGVLMVCLLPFLLNNTDIIISAKTLHRAQFLLFVASIICYFSSEKYYKFQINLIIILICYYVIFLKHMH